MIIAAIFLCIINMFKPCFGRNQPPTSQRPGARPPPTPSPGTGNGFRDLEMGTRPSASESERRRPPQTQKKKDVHKPPQLKSKDLFVGEPYTDNDALFTATVSTRHYDATQGDPRVKEPNASNFSGFTEDGVIKKVPDGPEIQPEEILRTRYFQLQCDPYPEESEYKYLWMPVPNKAERKKNRQQWKKWQRVHAMRSIQQGMQEQAEAGAETRHVIRRRRRAEQCQEVKEFVSRLFTKRR